MCMHISSPPPRAYVPACPRKATNNIRAQDNTSAFTIAQDRHVRVSLCPCLSPLMKSCRLVLRAAKNNKNINVVAVNDPFVPTDYMNYSELSSVGTFVCLTLTAAPCRAAQPSKLPIAASIITPASSPDHAAV